MSARMAVSGEKPYRVYRGGSARGRVPLERRDREPRRRGRSDDRPGPGRMVGDRRGPRRRRLLLGWSWRRWTLLTLVGLLVLFVFWGATGYLAVSSGVGAANARLPKNVRKVLAPDRGFLFSSPTNILLLGSDHASGQGAARGGEGHSDSITLLHTDPGRHRLVYLSIPRDLETTIPGSGTEKINAAMQFGGPTLAIETINRLLGSSLQVNHIVIVDFGQFVKLIDAIGGITVNVPENILSDRFDCPYATQQRCLLWQGWRFHKGPTHMTGRQALIFSRIRVNQLDPAWTDFARQHNQQLVEQATLAKLASPSLFFRLPLNGSLLLAPIATDLSTWQLLQLAWAKFRSSNGNTLHCRLGGTAETIAGGAYIVGNQQNGQVLNEVLDQSAPKPPTPGNLYAPGCTIGVAGNWK